MLNVAGSGTQHPHPPKKAMQALASHVIFCFAQEGKVRCPNLGSRYHAHFTLTLTSRLMTSHEDVVAQDSVDQRDLLAPLAPRPASSDGSAARRTVLAPTPSPRLANPMLAARKRAPERAEKQASKRA
jgi:hypothetical protein